MHTLGHGAASPRSSSNTQNRNRKQQQQQQQQQQQLQAQTQQQRAADNAHAIQHHRSVGAQAHTRTPVLTREPTLLESLSRNWRTYFPATGSGSPPVLRRRPLSFGGIIGAGGRAVPAAPPAIVHPDDDELQQQQARDEDGDHVLWAGWDEVVLSPGGTHTRVLLLAYATGVQVWDAQNLGAIRELLNLNFDSLHSVGPVLRVSVLPPPGEGVDEFKGARPLLGILMPTHLCVYSFTTHSVIKQIPFMSPVSIAARSTFIVISTSQPPALHILSSNTLLPLHTISLSVPPVFALSHRLLAYASPAPIRSPGPPRPTFISRARDASSHAARDALSHSVMRVGGEVWSGVRAAISTSPDLDDPDGAYGVSRSAPAASSSMHGRWTSTGHSHPARHDEGAFAGSGVQAGWVTVLDLAPLHQHQPPRHLTHFAPFAAQEHAGVAQLAFSSRGGTPMLGVVSHEGHGVSVFQLRPAAAGQSAAAASASGVDEREMPWHWYELRRGVTSARVESVVWERGERWVGVATGRRTVHVFPTNPYGGKPHERSHLEGRVRNASELQPLSTELNPLVRLRPSNPAADPSNALPEAPLAFTFLPVTASLALPPSLLPHVRSAASSPTPTRSIPSSPASLSSGGGHDPTLGDRGSFQDVLLFDPAAGMLALRRIVLDLAPPPSESAVGIAIPGAAGYGVSLPVPIGMGRKRPDATVRRQGELIAKETTIATWPLRRGLDWPEVRCALGPVDPAPTVPGKVSEAGKVSIGDYLSQAELSTHSRSADVLPRSIYLSHQFSFHAFQEDFHALLRRSQFNLPCTKIEVRKDVEVSAYAGDAESGAFIHGSAVAVAAVADLQQLDASSPVLGRGDPRRPIRGGSFDEPIASAMRSALDYSGQSPPVLPMLPNGGASSISMLDTLFPARTKHVVAAGVNEGLGRIRREIGKVRSPILRPTRVLPDAGLPTTTTTTTVARHVPLEFDEEDEAAFLEGEEVDLADDHDGGRSRDDGSGSGASASVSTPSTRSHVDLDNAGEGDDDALWDAWDKEAQAVVAEAETFDEISATGFMDEEQTPIMAAMSRGKAKARR